MAQDQKTTAKIIIGVTGAAILTVASMKLGSPTPKPVPTPPPLAAITAPAAPSFPAHWAKATTKGVLADPAGVEIIQYDWIIPSDGIDDDADCEDIDSADDAARPKMMIHKAAKVTVRIGDSSKTITWGGLGDFDCDGSVGTDADIKAFYACLRGDCCPTCTADLNNDGDMGTDADIAAMWQVISGHP